MDLDGDPKKWAKTFSERGLDFADAALIFAGRTISAEDKRCDYGKVRIITVGFLRGRMNGKRLETGSRAAVFSYALLIAIAPCMPGQSE
jgi:hypothetical protein